MTISSLLPELPSDGIPVLNPATGETIAFVRDHGASDVANAIEAADRAMAIATTPEARAAWLGAIARGLADNREELAAIVTSEQGKPIREARTEVAYAAGFFAYYAAHLHLLAPRIVNDAPDGAAWTVYQRPAGVAALITPWNFPLAMLAKKLSASLAAGCVSVVKPSELTPLSALALRELAIRAGVPEAFTTVVTGDASVIGDVLCSHSAVRVVSCTGSTQTGRTLLTRCADTVKRVALELGGNAPFIVFGDADIDQAADALMANKFRCAGQTCVCANRVLVESSVNDEFVEAVRARCARLVVGNGVDDATDIGPLINRAAWDKVARHVADAIDRGATLIRGECPDRPATEWGCWYPPTVLTGCSEAMLAFREETFGPVISIASFDSDAEAIRIANGTPFGLAGYVFSSDASRAAQAAAALRCGHVGVNTGAGPTPEAPFGGMKQSGIGREGGIEGLSEYTEVQTVATRR